MIPLARHSILSTALCGGYSHRELAKEKGAQRNVRDLPELLKSREGVWVLSSNLSDARDLRLSAIQWCVFSLHQHFPRRTCGGQDGGCNYGGHLSLPLG